MVLLTASDACDRHRFFGKDENNPRYKGRARSILFNLRDTKNPDLRRRVAALILRQSGCKVVLQILQGIIQPERLTLMDPTDLASDKLKEYRRTYAAYAMKSSTVGGAEDQHSVSDLFLCRRCQKRKCTYYQMQTRSADEPMTTFVTVRAVAWGMES
eukprot:767000-Hanusia_phi.AAC.4